MARKELTEQRWGPVAPLRPPLPHEFRLFFFPPCYRYTQIVGLLPVSLVLFSSQLIAGGG